MFSSFYGYINHNMLVDVLCKASSVKETVTSDIRRSYSHSSCPFVIMQVSLKFKRLATDYSLWKGRVSINPYDDDLEKLEFVEQECLNSGTRIFEIIGECGHYYSDSHLAEFYHRTPNFSSHVNLRLVAHTYHSEGMYEIVWETPQGKSKSNH